MANTFSIVYTVGMQHPGPLVFRITALGNRWLTLGKCASDFRIADRYESRQEVYRETNNGRERHWNDCEPAGQLYFRIVENDQVLYERPVENIFLKF